MNIQTEIRVDAINRATLNKNDINIVYGGSYNTESLLSFDQLSPETKENILKDLDRHKKDLLQPEIDKFQRRIDKFQRRIDKLKGKYDE